MLCLNRFASSPTGNNGMWSFVDVKLCLFCVDDDDDEGAICGCLREALQSSTTTVTKRLIDDVC